MAKKISRNTFLTDNSPSIKAFASIAGSKESEGPIGTCFDKIETDLSLDHIYAQLHR